MSSFPRRVFLALALFSPVMAQPDLTQLEQMIARFAPVSIRVDTARLSEGDRKALPKLLEAARVIDDLYLTQVWSGNHTLLAQLRQDASPLGRARLHYFLLNKGPWSELDGGKAFLTGVPPHKLPGANFYPADMTREEFERWAKDHPEATGFFSVVRRDSARRLTLVPYSREYRAPLERAAALLREAATLSANESLKRFLTLRADAFLSDDYYRSDVAWMDLDAPLDITIGPYETYTDELFGYKAAFEAYITVRDDDATARLDFLSSRLQEIEDHLPIEPRFRNPKLGAMAPIRVVNQVLATGDGAHGVRTAAFNLPNDERVVREKGSKRVMLKNIQEAKFRATLEPIARRVLSSADQRDLSFDAFFTHIVAHELTHGIGPHQCGNSTPRKELKELYSAIEEAKADVAGLFMLQHLFDRGNSPLGGGEAAERRLYTTFLASAFRSLRFGLHEAHGKGMALQFNYLADKGAFVARPDGAYSVDFFKIKAAVRDLAHDLLTLEATGDYAGAKRMLDSLAVIRPPLEAALDRLAGIPTDIEPVSSLEEELAARYGAGQRARIERGIRQARQFWRDEDGNAAAFDEFVRSNFAGTQEAVDALFTRCESLWEQIDGHMLEIVRGLRTQVDLDRGPIQPYDEIFAGYDPAAHLSADLFQNKLAFVVLLNFPLTTLDERLTEGARWSRRQWAEVRLAQRFSRRVPADVNLGIAEARAQAEQYISQYNIWMGRLVDDGGRRPFPRDMRLLSHWNLRDQIKADYAEKDGLPRQRMIARVMEDIVRQTIPKAAVNNSDFDWNPYAPAAPAEPDTRYAVLLSGFRAMRRMDPYSPTAPTHIARMFDEARELPEARVRQMFERVLTSPLVPKVAALISKRLGRPLEPFDLWYNGFLPRNTYTEFQLDEITRKKYPTPEAYKKDMPRMFEALGFSSDRARFLAENIVVDPARGSGHAWGAQLRSEPAHLRTRVGPAGMDYKGYNIAVHEMGHNVEQTFSLKQIDHWLLNGVPNTAFTEAIAFLFQARDLELLGLSKPSPQEEALRTLNDFWGTYEIAGVALLDMDVWHWMYDHPDATPAELKQAVLSLAADLWNQYYAPVFHTRDVVLLGIYSHMIDSFLYLPDYPIGHLIAHQLEEHMRAERKLGPEIERVARIGSIAPDLWMEAATGAPVGPDALLAATERALEAQ